MPRDRTLLPVHSQVACCGEWAGMRSDSLRPVSEPHSCHASSTTAGWHATAPGHTGPAANVANPQTMQSDVRRLTPALASFWPMRRQQCAAAGAPHAAAGGLCGTRQPAAGPVSPAAVVWQPAGQKFCRLFCLGQFCQLRGGGAGPDRPADPQCLRWAQLRLRQECWFVAAAGCCCPCLNRACSACRGRVDAAQCARLTGSDADCQCALH